MRIPLIYALHSGNLYGTERMALWTAAGLTDRFDPVIMAPKGPALEEAARMGFSAVPFGSPGEFALAVRPFFARSRRLVFLATGVVHSLAAVAWNWLYRRPMVHLHVVHGGTDERLSYGRKRRLHHSRVTFVAVSAFVKERLIANGVAPHRVEVIENFLPESRVQSAVRRAAFTADGISRIVVVSRVDPIKRIDLLLDALDRTPELSCLPIRVLGTGWELEKLRERAAKNNPNVVFAGFQSAVDEELASADLLLHLCPSEPFGLAVLEAMAAGIPVLVADSGGAGSLVENNVTGFHFRANDADALSARLKELLALPAVRLNGVVQAAAGTLQDRFSASARIADYRRLLEGKRL